MTKKTQPSPSIELTHLREQEFEFTLPETIAPAQDIKKAIDWRKQRQKGQQQRQRAWSLMTDKCLDPDNECDEKKQIVKRPKCSIGSHAKNSFPAYYYISFN